MRDRLKFWKREMEKNIQMHTSQTAPEIAWVQCEDTKCMKWRRIPKSMAESIKEVNWFCHLNPDKHFASCDVEQEEVKAPKGEKFVFSLLEEGSLVWVKMAGYPRWPAIISSDIIPNNFASFDKDGDVKYYHVEYFGEPRTHSWALAKEVEVYGSGNAPSPITVTTHKAMSSVRSRKSFQKAIQQADQLMSFDAEERLCHCVFKPTETNDEPDVLKTEKDVLLLPFPKKMRNSSLGRSGKEISHHLGENLRKEDSRLVVKKSRGRRISSSIVEKLCNSKQKTGDSQVEMLEYRNDGFDSPSELCSALKVPNQEDKSSEWTNRGRGQGRGRGGGQRQGKGRGRGQGRPTILAGMHSFSEMGIVTEKTQHGFEMPNANAKPESSTSNNNSLQTGVYLLNINGMVVPAILPNDKIRVSGASSLGHQAPRQLESNVKNQIWCNSLNETRNSVENKRASPENPKISLNEKVAIGNNERTGIESSSRPSSLSSLLKSLEGDTEKKKIKSRQNSDKESLSRVDYNNQDIVDASTNDVISSSAYQFLESAAEAKLKRKFKLQYQQHADMIRLDPRERFITYENKKLDLYQFYKLVKEAGGFSKASTPNCWQEICKNVTKTDVDSKFFSLKSSYKKVLLPFEQFMNSIPVTAASKPKSPTEEDESAINSSIIYADVRKAKKSAKCEKREIVQSQRDLECSNVKRKNKEDGTLKGVAFKNQEGKEEEEEDIISSLMDTEVDLSRSFTTSNDKTVSFNQCKSMDSDEEDGIIDDLMGITPNEDDEQILTEFEDLGKELQNAELSLYAETRNNSSLERENSSFIESALDSVANTFEEDSTNIFEELNALDETIANFTDVFDV